MFQISKIRILFFFKDLSIYLKADIQRQKGKCKELFHLLVHYLNGCPGHGWAHSFWVSFMEQRPNHLHLLLLFQAHKQGSGSKVEQPGIKLEPTLPGPRKLFQLIIAQKFFLCFINFLAFLKKEILDKKIHLCQIIFSRDCVKI